MACFDHLPQLCLEVVGERLASLFSERSARPAAAACAASLTLVGDERFSELSRGLYDAVVDPGCVAAARAAAEADGFERGGRSCRGCQGCMLCPVTSTCLFCPQGLAHHQRDKHGDA